MAKLSDKVENALDETRMLILGAQVLLGFEYQAVFQQGYTKLPHSEQQLKLVGLGLMLVAVGLLIAPTAFHRIVESGNDSQRLVAFTTAIAALALLPFALSMGIDFHFAAQTVLGASAALPAAVAAAGFALVFWYGLEWFIRATRKAPAPEEDDMAEGTSLANKIKQVLTEARVVLPGVQALLGFQLIAMFTEAFEKLPRTSQYIHLASLALIAVAIVFLMAPAAFHRIVDRGEDTERVHTFSSVMVLSALVPLALGLAGDFYVVLEKVLESAMLATLLAAATLVFFYGLWFGVTLGVRAAR